MQEEKRRAIRILLQGGLGNQLFGLTAAWVLASTANAGLTLDYRILHSGSNRKREQSLTHFKLPPDPQGGAIGIQTRALTPVAARWYLRYLKYVSVGNTFISDRFGYDPAAESAVVAGTTIVGYFQCHRYLKVASSLGLNMRLDPIIKTPACERAIARARREKPIMVHIRRGDYLDAPDFFGILGPSYYQVGLAELRKRGFEGKIWIFSDSDDEDWQHLLGVRPSEYLIVQRDLNLTTGIDSFLLMREARALITANSSFSWWAAATSPDESQIIYPRPWFVQSVVDEIAPSHWTPISTL